MECGQGVQPIPDYRGNGFPGRCCPDYSFEGEAHNIMIPLLLNHCGHVISTLDINECQENAENLCSDGCVDEPNTYTCSCPEGKTLAMDGFNCGGTFQLPYAAIIIYHTSFAIILLPLYSLSLQWIRVPHRRQSKDWLQLVVRLMS